MVPPTFSADFIRRHRANDPASPRVAHEPIPPKEAARKDEEESGKGKGVGARRKFHLALNSVHTGTREPIHYEKQNFREGKAGVALSLWIT